MNVKSGDVGRTTDPWNVASRHHVTSVNASMIWYGNGVLNMV